MLCVGKLTFILKNNFKAESNITFYWFTESLKRYGALSHFWGIFSEKARKVRKSCRVIEEKKSYNWNNNFRS